MTIMLLSIRSAHFQTDFVPPLVADMDVVLFSLHPTQLAQVFRRGQGRKLPHTVAMHAYCRRAIRADLLVLKLVSILFQDQFESSFQLVQVKLVAESDCSRDTYIYPLDWQPLAHLDRIEVLPISGDR